MALLFGYNTNGFAHHRLEDTIEILAELGYDAVGLTLDYGHLDPFAADLLSQVNAVRCLLQKHQLRCVVETGARFLLDPRNKHQPTLLSDDLTARKKRIDFLQRSITIAADLGADAVSFWSGTPSQDDSEPSEALLHRLCVGLEHLLEFAERRQMPLAFEPEPGMLLDTLESARPLFERISCPLLQLTVDIGHVHLQQEGPIPQLLTEWSEKLGNVHIEDMNTTRHDHLMFGEGEIDFVPILRSLNQMGYSHGVYVELSRHSHDAVNTARQAIAWLKAAEAQAEL